jgi:hypothetical protein
MNYNPSNPKKTRRQLTICTPIGTQDVRVEREEIVGRWQETIRDFCARPDRLLVEDFLNWSDEPQEIARFTMMYAPLGERYPKISCPTPGAEFRFSLELWRDVQDYFRNAWIFRAAAPESAFAPLSSADHLEIRGKELVYRASCLASFMELELTTASLDRLRYCEGNDCSTPYFVAAHLKQRYCSSVCAESAQAEAKKKWWKEKGSAWLKAQKKRQTLSTKNRRSKQAAKLL